EEAMDRRTSMGVIGDLGKYAQFQAAESMRAAADNPSGGGMGEGLGMGMGIAMAQQMANPGPWGAQPQAPHAPPPPPPAPAETVWHVAENGATKGPFSRADLGRMVTEQSFSRETMVWSQGMAGWTAAGEVAALAQLFTVMPPPPPPPAG
ncbi:MAG: GYF domain-containing protein, partial [Pseudomonadota bacterium]